MCQYLFIKCPQVNPLVSQFFCKMRKKNLHQNKTKPRHISILHWLSCSLKIGIRIVHWKIHINQGLIHSTVSGFWKASGDLFGSNESSVSFHLSVFVVMSTQQASQTSSTISCFPARRKSDHSLLVDLQLLFWFYFVILYKVVMPRQGF